MGTSSSKDAILIPAGRIDQLNFLVRGHRVMLDRDLANLCGVETRVLNPAVRRNLDRFPDDFMFSLTRPEVRNISHIVICSTLKHARNVFAFTEQGGGLTRPVRRSGPPSVADIMPRCVLGLPRQRLRLNNCSKNAARATCLILSD
jgi:hypothetical protein